jgi:cold shock CspA family protein
MALRRFTGTILNWNVERAFGFCRVDGPFGEAMVHIRQFHSDVCVYDIKRGTRISYFLENHAKGLRAIRVEII